MPRGAITLGFHLAHLACAKVLTFEKKRDSESYRSATPVFCRILTLSKPEKPVVQQKFRITVLKRDAKPQGRQGGRKLGLHAGKTNSGSIL